MAGNLSSLLSDAGEVLSLCEVFPLGLVLCEGEGGILWANAQAEALLGAGLGSGDGGGTLAAWQPVRLDGRPVDTDDFAFRRALREGRAIRSQEVGIARPEGGHVWLSLSALPTSEGRVLLAFEDIGPRVRGTAVRDAHARLVGPSRRVGLQAFLGLVLSELGTLTDSPVGFYAIVEDHPANLPLQAWSSRPQAVCVQAKGVEVLRGEDPAGLWTEALRQARPILQEGSCPQPEARNEGQGVFRSLAVPVLRQGKVCAVLGVGNKPRPYDDGDAASVQQLAGLAWELVELKLALETAERQRGLTMEVLGILARTDAPTEAAASILTVIRRALGIEAAAIRLAQEDDFTYAAHEGFPEAFLQAENCLRARTLNHEPLCDEAGRPLFECTCGLVIMGLTDATSAVFTPGGSAWSSDAATLQEPPWVRDPRLHPRDRCAHSGYRSIALVPIRSRERIVGLLQLNDPRPHRLSLEMVTFLEGLASSVGIALERKKDLASLEDSLGNLRLVHEVAKVGSWAWELGSNRNVWSESFFHLYGLDPGAIEPSYDAWLQALHPDDRPAAVGYLQEAVAQGRELEFEWRAVLGDGSVRWLLSRGQPQRGSDGKVDRYIGLVIDVTERKRAENALRESQERLRLLLDHAPAALAMFDRDMRYLAASRRWQDDYRLGEAALLGRTHYDVFPELSEELKAIHRRGLAGEAIRAEVDRFEREDGTVQWLRWEVLPWHNAEGEVGGIVIFSEDISARHEAETEVKASRAKLAAALESMTDAVFISDPQGRFIEFNEAFATFHKFGSKIECARALAEHPELLEVYLPAGEPAPIPQRAVPRALRGERATNVEYALRRQDTGETWTGSYSFAPIRDAEGGISGAVVAARDVTEQKRTEKRLLDSEEKFNKSFHAAPLIMTLSRPEDGRILEMNEEFCRCTGFTRGEALGKTALALGLLRGQDLDRLARILAGEGSIRNEESTLYAKDGRPIFCLVSVETVEVGGESLLLSMHADITERKHAEESVQESESRFRGLFEHAPAAVLEEDYSEAFARLELLRSAGVVDLRAYLEAHPEETLALAARVQVVQANSASKVLLGVPDGVTPLGDLPHFAHADSLPSFREELITLFEGRKEFEDEIPLQDANGQKRDVHLRVSVLPGHERDTFRALASFTDLTSWKAAEAERQRLARELNHLQRLDSLGRLAGGISHDMNNVLGAIMAVGSILKNRHSDDPRIAHDAEILLHAAIRGRDLVKGLRDFSRKELESAAELDLNTLARQEAELLERTTLKKVSIELDLQEDLSPVFGEASSLANALMNLCVNACDAMPHGGTLTMSTRNLGQGYVEIAIQDDGEGMSSETLARAMDPFFTTKPIGKGTGLGLSQVYGTVKAHAGSLDIQSRPGKGTRVSMSFPTSWRSVQAAKAVSAEASRPARSLDILLVDDEELIRGTVMDLLRTLGHRTQSASSGLEALRRIEAGMAVDLVALDLNMPGMDGEETISRLRILRPKLPVLFVTGYADNRISSILKRFPNVRILKKPFDLDELQQVLSGWL